MPQNPSTAGSASFSGPRNCSCKGATLPCPSGTSPEKVARMMAKIRQQLVLPFAAILEEGIAAGGVRPMDTALAGWALTGLIFTAGQPFLDPSTTPDRIRFALDVFANGILDKGR